MRRWSRFMGVEHVIHLIDDDPAIVNSLAGLLRARQFSVQAYGGPTEFLDVARPGIGSCLVTDVYMPDMTGLELVAKLGQAGVALPTVFITAYADLTLRAEASKLEAVVEILENPFKNRALVSAICGALHIEDLGISQEPSAELLRSRFSSLT